MSANLLAPQAVPDNERCLAKFEQRKQRQAQYYNRGAIDPDPLKRGDTVRLKPFQMGKREWQKGTVRKRLDERSYKVETPYKVVRRNRFHLRLTNEPSPPLTDELPNEISDEVPEVPAPSFAQSYESQTSSTGEVSLPASSQRRSSPSCSEVPSAVVTSPPKPVFRRSVLQRSPPKHLNDF